MSKRYSILPHFGYRLGSYSLETIQPEDIESVRRWRNEQIVVLRQNEVITPEMQVAYFENHVWPDLDNPEPKQILFRYLKEGELIGYGGLVHMRHEERISELSYLSDPARLEPALDETEFRIYIWIINHIAFRELRLDKLTSEAYDVPERKLHIQIMEDIGFISYAVVKDVTSVNGVLFDSIHHCLEKAAYDDFPADVKGPIEHYDQPLN